MKKHIGSRIVVFRFDFKAWLEMHHIFTDIKHMNVYMTIL